MVLIAASICSKVGKVLISRQFVEMNKSRIEGLLSAFPKLISGSAKNSQHTFVETDSVRYVYQPMDKIYVLLITTKTSNILEDLETLRLFARVIPEYCRSLEEEDILENSFNLIFAFDEVVSLGYRESVNLSTIRTFVEMDSHDEKVFQAVRQTQEREAKQKMREKAKELQRQKMEASKKGGRPPTNYGFMSSSSSITVNDSLSTPSEPPKPTYFSTTSSAPRKPTNSKAMKLGGKSRDVDSFVDQLKSEGQNISETSTLISKIAPPPVLSSESVHVKLEEKISVSLGRDGGLENMEILGMMTLRISSETYGRLKLKIDSNYNKDVQLQAHPNIDKELLRSHNSIGLKKSGNPFPLNTDVGVLKWRFQSGDESHVPFSINCWPTDNGSGGCDVNIEYSLDNTSLELNDVVITIPIPTNSGSPIVAECDGEYNYEKRGFLYWQIPFIDEKNKTGSMEFSMNGNTEDFFPILITFYSKKLFSGLAVSDIISLEDESSVKHSLESVMITDKYEIV